MKPHNLFWLALGVPLSFAVLAVVPRNAAPPPRVITLVAERMAFRIQGEEDENPTLRIRAGERVTLLILNHDVGIEHDLSLPTLGLRTRVLAYGEEERILLPALEPGTYRYLCVLHPMMRGMFQVE